MNVFPIGQIKRLNLQEKLALFYLCKQFGVLVVSNGLHDGSGTLRRVARLENARAHEHSIEALTKEK